MLDDEMPYAMATWTNAELLRFAANAYVRMKHDAEAIEQLRLDNKELSTLLRTTIRPTTDTSI